MGQAELARKRLAPRVEVDADDHVGAGDARALNDIEPDPAQTEHDDVRSGLDFGGVDHGTDAGRHAAADVADLLERCVLRIFATAISGKHGEVGKGRASHVVVQRLAAERESAGAVGHHALALRRAYRRAKIGLARQAGLALAALGDVERDHVIAAPDGGDAGAEVDDDAGALMAEDRGKQALGIGAGAGELVGVADAGGFELDQHLARARPVEANRLDRQRCAGAMRDCSTNVQVSSD